MAVRMRRRTLGYLALGVAALGAFIGLRSICVSAYLSYGLATRECPDGRPRQTVHIQAYDVLRGGKARVEVGVQAHFLAPDTRSVELPLSSFSPSVLLVDAAGKETPLPAAEKWETQLNDARSTRVAMPPVPDGDYRLRVKVTSRLGEDSVDVPLPLYAPARVHVLTDRPLYEPGNTVRFRAVVLRAKDLAPLDGRPGTWTVRDPSGEVVLEEKAPAGDWGVVAGSFPLDRGALVGMWKVAWASGGATDEVLFKVEPFTLPRFRVEAEPDRPFYRPGDVPRLSGRVVYASGAPVGGASLSIDWDTAGEWPPPTEWMASLLPKKAVAGADGRFSLPLPKVPADLRKQATLQARISAVDAAGDRVEGGAALLLSEDALQVSAVTELGDGLADGFNNRVYLRATTADGRVLPGARLTVRRAWDPKDRGVEAVADEDGVASLQIDPGTPVNVVIPPMPFRPPPRQSAVNRGQVMELLSGEEPGLADQAAFDGWVAALEPCARYSDGTTQVSLGLRVATDGTLSAAVSEAGPLEECALAVVRTRRLAAGPARVYSATFTFSDHQLPKLSVLTESVVEEPEGLSDVLSALVLGARDCVPESTSGGSLPRGLVWQTKKDSAEVTLGWADLPGEQDRSLLPVAACAQAKLTRARLPQPATRDNLGVARLEVEPSHRMQESKPQATTLLGYEFRVSAKDGNHDAGSTRLVLTPGTVPPVRLRASSVLAQPGETVDVEVLRGPGFDGQLPEKLFLTNGREKVEAKLDPKTRVARFTVPAALEGWSQVEWSGSRTLLYVRPRAQLSVEVAPDKERYAPGQLAHLAVRTSVNGKGGPAAVGLVGVDESLSQLAPLPGSEELSRVRPKVEVASPAFGVLQGQALAMGRIRGRNAAAATVLRVTSLPTAAELEPAVAVRGESSFVPEVELVDRFFPVLRELYAQARTWEEKAPEGEQASPKLVASLWERALEACEKRGVAVTDAFGRRMKLSRLPAQLLALTDPREVVRTKTRLPEDVENWQAWVAKEEP